MEPYRNRIRRTPLLIGIALILLVPFPVGARVADGRTGTEPAASGRTGDTVRELSIDARVEYQTRIEAVYAFYLRNSNTAGAADLTFGCGASGASVLAGNWDGL